MGNCEPHVRATAPQFGGTKRLVSAADLTSTELGRYALAVLQRLLLVPKGELPPHAHIICEVALPLQQALWSSPPAAVGESDQQGPQQASQPVTLSSSPPATQPVPQCTQTCTLLQQQLA